MNYTICTISFRHELVSFQQLVQFAKEFGFTGIELWGVHAKALQEAYQTNIAGIVQEMRARDIKVSMISDYVNLLASKAQFSMDKQKYSDLIHLAHQFETDKIRIFAGNKGSSLASDEEWLLCAGRLRELAEIAEALGMYLVVETHPDTFADTLPSTLRLLEETAHDRLRINLDFLHLWETGTPAAEAYTLLKPWVVNFHFKNISHPEYLGVFTPGNIYSPSGQREGITSLAEGALNYADIVQLLETKGNCFPASLEWFGKSPFQSLIKDLAWLRQMEICLT